MHNIRHLGWSTHNIQHLGWSTHNIWGMHDSMRLGCSRKYTCEPLDNTVADVPDHVSRRPMMRI